MESDSNGHQHDPQEPQCIDSMSALPSDAGVNPDGFTDDFFPASEVLDLALEVTQTSAEVYELIAAVAGALAEPAKSDMAEEDPPLQRHLAPLRGIDEAIKETERHLRLLESKTVTIRPEILELFLEDCWSALLTFKEVSGLLAGLMELDGSTKPSATAAEILSQIMKRLDNCSKEVSGLSVTGLAASSQCLAQTAFNLQDRAGKLAG